MLGPIHRLMARFLSISGKAWNKKQLALAANGQPRSWRILEAADGSDVDSCVRSLLSTALEPIKVAKQTLVACCHRLQRFAMASAGMCGLHSYLECHGKGYHIKCSRCFVMPPKNLWIPYCSGQVACGTNSAMFS